MGKDRAKNPAISIAFQVSEGKGTERRKSPFHIIPHPGKKMVVHVMIVRLEIEVTPKNPDPRRATPRTPFM